MRTATHFPPGPDTLILCDIENLAGAAIPTAPVQLPLPRPNGRRPWR